MASLPASSDRPEAPLFNDGLGERVITPDTATGDLLQVFRLQPVLTAVPSFEFALRERTARLANFRHGYYARVRRVDRTLTPSSLALVSDHVEGIRLAEMLRVAREKRLQLDINAALCLIRQLVPAVALLHENARDVGHGLIGPERLVVTPHARLIIVEHVLGSAIEQLQYGRDRLWREFRIAAAPSAGAPRLDHRADVTGIGLVALALLLGRAIEADEFPQQVPKLLEQARERSPLGDERPLSTPLRGWLSRALQLDVRRAFASAPEAAAALDDVIAEDSGYVSAPVALETFLSRYISALVEEPPAPAVPATPIAVRPPVPLPAQPTSYAPPPTQPGAPGHVAAPAPPGPVVYRPPAAQPSAPVHPPPATAHVPPAVAPTRAPAPAPAVLPDVAATRGPAEPGHRDHGPAQAGHYADATARPLSEMLDVSDLVQPMAADPRPLFNPDAPFNVAGPQVAAEPAVPERRSLRTLLMAFLLVALSAGGYVVFRTYIKPSGSPATGTLIVRTNPAGVQVFVDGVERGVTPARLSVSPGAHILELRGRGVPRVIPLTVTAGGEASQYIELAEAPATGQIAIQSDVAGAKVLVDGVERGIAPTTITDLAPGEHEVILQTETATARHLVTVQAGVVASLVAPLNAAVPAGPVSGWVSVKAPFTVEIREHGRLLGTTDTDRVMMAAGRHELELVNAALGLHMTKVVHVPPGRVAPVTLELPRGVVNLNASPWAEVWIDGERIGETPLGNVSLTIGPHEIVFRHPQLGEKRHAISVTTSAPVRLSVQMQP